MSTTSSNSFRRARGEDPSATSVVAFRSRVSDKGISDVSRESADVVGEVEEPATIHPPDPEGGEVLLW